MIRKKLQAVLLATLFTAPVIAQESNKDEILYRPAFHFTPKKNWMNDPNGLVYINGTYHLYFQHWPYGNKWGPMHWGHATSKDLIKWEEQPIALYPDRFGYIFSGSAVADVNNTSGFGNGKNAPIVAMFTYHDPYKDRAGANDTESQGIAYSLDNGQTWTKYDEGNPVIKNPGIKDFRDPKVTWDAQHNMWVMILAAKDRAQIYSSQNLKQWNYLSDFGVGTGAHGGVWECPDLFPLKVEGSNETKWVLLQSVNPGGPNGGSATQYFIGDFDGKTFTLDMAFEQRLKNETAVWLDYGKDNYAGVTWSNLPGNENSRIMTGWMANISYAEKVPTETWRSANTLPRTLKLIKKGKDYSIITTPVTALSNYIDKTDTYKKIAVKGKTTLSEKGKANFATADISFEIKGLKKDVYTFTLSNQAGESLSFGINNNENYLFVDRSQSSINSSFHKIAGSPSKAPLYNLQKTGKFRVVLDKSSIEIFYNDGEKVMTEIFFTSSPFNTFYANSSTPFEVENLSVNQLKF